MVGLWFCLNHGGVVLGVFFLVNSLVTIEFCVACRIIEEGGWGSDCLTPGVPNSQMLTLSVG